MPSCVHSHVCSASVGMAGPRDVTQTHTHLPARFPTPVHTQTPVGRFFPLGTVSVFRLMYSLFLVVEAQWPQRSQMLCEVEELSGGEGAIRVIVSLCLFLKMVPLRIREENIQ